MVQLIRFHFFFFLENKKIGDLLEAIKQKTVTLDTLKYATDVPCASPAASVSGKNNRFKQDRSLVSRYFQSLKFSSEIF